MISPERVLCVYVCTFSVVLPRRARMQKKNDERKLYDP